MTTELQDLIADYLKADALLEAQEARIVGLEVTKKKSADALIQALREAVEVNEALYIHCGDGQLLYCADEDGDLSIERLQTLSIGELVEYKAENR